jgi:hypothetical protein
MSNTALDQYIDLITTAQNRTLPDTIDVENHHILPISLVKHDPEWAERNNNLTVPLTLSEHYLAHQLLHQAFPDDKSLETGFQYFKTMARSFGSYATPNNYAKAKKAMKKKISATLKGRTKETHEYLRKLSEQNTGENHPMYDSTIYILQKINDPKVMYAGTQYYLYNELELCRSHLCRHIRAELYGIEESGGGLRKSVAGYRCIGSLNNDVEYIAVMERHSGVSRG